MTLTMRPGSVPAGKAQRPSPVSSSPPALLSSLLRVPLVLKIAGTNVLIVAAALAAVVFVGHELPVTRSAIFIMVGALGVSLVAGVGLTTLALRPLRGMEQTLIRFQGGDQSARVPASPLADDDIERVGHTLNHLLDGLTPRGEPAKPAYTLRVELFEPLPQDLGITRNESVVRYSYSSVARFRLFDAAGNQMLVSEASGLSSYEVTNSEFATVSGQLNARERVLEEISNEIKSQLAVWFRSRRGRTA